MRFKKKLRVIQYHNFVTQFIYLFHLYSIFLFLILFFIMQFPCSITTVLMIRETNYCKIIRKIELH